MPLKTPTWWYRRNADGTPWWRPVLWPLSLIWQAVNAVKAATAKPYRSSLKVISVGNATLGGSGKTPLVDTLLTCLREDGAVGLSRGHGGTLTGPVRVDPQRHTADEVGDEPLMLAQRHEMWIARDRVAGLRAIEATDARVVVVDDAHQNLKFLKDVHILVVDADTRDGAWPFGDEGVCPYGPMREPLSAAVARSDLVVPWLPEGVAEVAPDLMARFGDKPVFPSRLNAENFQRPTRVLAFAGIAKPWKFEATLSHLGAEVIGMESFPDHVSPRPEELEALRRRAADLEAELVTTEKDYVRLPAHLRQGIRCVVIYSQPLDTQDFIIKVRQISGI